MYDSDLAKMPKKKPAEKIVKVFLHSNFLQFDEFSDEKKSRIYDSDSAKMSKTAEKIVKVCLHSNFLQFDEFSDVKTNLEFTIFCLLCSCEIRMMT